MMNILNINDLSKEQVQYIDGLMLGDGCIADANAKHYTPTRYIQPFAHKYKEWAQKIQSGFHEFGIDSGVVPKVSRIKDKKYMGWVLHTRGDVNKSIFPLLRERWYNGRMNKNGWIIKTIPSDIDLSSPQLLANWYMGDGTYNKEHMYCCLATGGFTKLKLFNLCHQLNKILGVHPTITKTNYIYMSVQDSLVFLDYIKDYKVDCFAYKWGE